MSPPDRRAWLRRAHWFTVRGICAVILLVMLNQCAEDKPRYRLASAEVIEQLRFVEAREATGAQGASNGD